MGIKIIMTLIILASLSGCLERSPTEVSYSDIANSRGSLLVRGGLVPLSYASLKKYILKPKCMSCHTGADAKPVKDPIDFTTYETAMIERFAPLLLKGKPEKSRLFQSVLSGEMPEEGILHKKEIEFIRQWIKACAPKDALSITPKACSPDDDDDDDWGDGDDDFDSDEF